MLDSRVGLQEKTVAESVMRSLFLSAVLFAVAGCGGASPPPTPLPLPPAPALPPPHAAPLLPTVEGELVGMPGHAVPGMGATYVWTGLGWIGNDGDVVFEAVIRYDADLALGCGILRRARDGLVNPVLMQDQLLQGTGGGRVKHPQLPLHAAGGTLLIPALVEGGAVRRALFAAPRAGGEPLLVAGAQEGEFRNARYARDGAVIVEVIDGGLASLLRVPPGEPPELLCADCRPGVASDGDRHVARRADGAYAVADSGALTPLARRGDPVPGTRGVVTEIAGAWVTGSGEIVLHALTDDPQHPEALLRADAALEPIALCGSPAPGTTGRYGSVSPAAGRGPDALFGASVEGDAGVSSAAFAAPLGGTAHLVAATGAPAGDLPGVLALDERQLVAGAGGQVVSFARVFFAGAETARGLFLHTPHGAPERLLTLEDRPTALAGSTIVSFLYEPREAVAVDAAGGILVHVGIRLDRQPDAVYGALLYRPAR